MVLLSLALGVSRLPRQDQSLLIIRIDSTRGGGGFVRADASANIDSKQSILTCRQFWH